MRSPWQQVKTEGPKLREGGRGGAGGLTGSLGDYGMVGVMMAQPSEVGGGGAMTCSVWKMQNLDSPQFPPWLRPQNSGLVQSFTNCKCQMWKCVTPIGLPTLPPRCNLLCSLCLPVL